MSAVDEWRRMQAQMAEGDSPKAADFVNHPPHYTQGGIECIDAIKAAVVGAPPVEAVFIANILKYVWRYRKKNGMADLKKARWYLDALIEEVESQENGKVD